MWIFDCADRDGCSPRRSGAVGVRWGRFGPLVAAAWARGCARVGSLLCGTGLRGGEGRCRGLGVVGVVAAVLASVVVPAGAASDSAEAAGSAPGNLAATVVDGEIKLSWDAPTEDATSVTGYQILRSHAGADLTVLKSQQDSELTSFTDAQASRADMTYDYQVEAWRGAALSDGSDEVSAVIPHSCGGTGFNSSYVDVPVTAVPITISSTADDYFVLFVRPNLDADYEIPVSLTLGEAGTTTLTEQLSALPVEHYRVEKYPVDDPADVDGDCLSDIVEQADLGTLNPLNRVPEIDFANGNVAIPDQETFEALSYQGRETLIDTHLHDLAYVKFYLYHLNTDRPGVYFMNTVTHRAHYQFQDAVKYPSITTAYRDNEHGEIIYHPNVVAPDGSLGVYRFEFQPWDTYSFGRIQRAYDVLAASMPLLENNLLYHPFGDAGPVYERERDLYDGSRVEVLLTHEIFPDVPFINLNPGLGFGLLRVMSPDERPDPRDIVIFDSLPNDLPRVAGIITTVPQTPLSHVNLRALQDRVPNAFIRDALVDTTIDSLIDSHIRYSVTESEYTIRAATKAEVDAHYEVSRPAETQTPERDLAVTEIAPLSDVEFGDWTAFGVKAANVAVLGSLGFADGTVPDGFAVPFYFYDEFMKANDIYADIEEILADADFQSDYDTQEDELKELRNAIKDGTTPDWIITALEDMHAEFPDGTSLRYRSSTNNEDLPGFSGAGLYDSKTQDPDETADDGIDKSIKSVWASLWNFRAFVERDFYRVDHAATAMGVLVHPNYSDELANGVAVSHDPIGNRAGAYYVNTQIGEDLVTNPYALSLPEELLLLSDGSSEVLVRSNQVEPDRLLMTDAQIQQLRSHLGTIHDDFKALYAPAADERFAMEIEFKITAEDVLAIKQARPWVFRPINRPPSFLSSETGFRQVAEGTANGTDIGLPVAAADPEGDDLTYSLGGPDAEVFSLDSATGQLRTLGVLDYEADDTFEVDVTLRDASNPSADTITVTIDVIDMNDEPSFPTSETGIRTVPENTGELSGLSIGAPIGAVDQDFGAVLTHSLTGADAVLFDIAPSSGQLLTRADLDYESSGEHWLTLSVHDGQDRQGPSASIDDSIVVKIVVGNVDEAGALSLSMEQPLVDTELTAALTDPDGATSGRTWSWERSTDRSNWIPITGADSRAYTPGVADLGNYLQVTVEYSDAHGPGQRIQEITGNPTEVAPINNRDPVFDAAPHVRSVLENSTAGTLVGMPVEADDPDGDSLSYRLSGDANFAVDDRTGQIRVASGAALDHERSSTRTVEITASDPSNADAIATVTINITNVNDPPEFGTSPDEFEVSEDAEEGDLIGRPVTATDADEDPLSYTLISASPFDIDETTGQIEVGAGAVLDSAVRDSYTVTVQARDTAFATATVNVTIKVVEEHTTTTTTTTGGGGGGGPAAAVRISGAVFAARDAQAVFTATVTGTARRHTLNWVAAGPEFTAASDGERFTLIPLTGGTYTVTVTATDSRGALLTDTAALTALTDIAESHFVSEIVWLAEQRITHGCSAYSVCPQNPVTRAQMASFLARALNLPATDIDYFEDDNDSTHQDNINRLAEARITQGCASEAFCPHNPVTRAQMASFLARALNLPATDIDYFEDDNDSTHQDNINRLAEARITQGCASEAFCPHNPVTRAQMAAFLYRARHLIKAARTPV